MSKAKTGSKVHRDLHRGMSGGDAGHLQGSVNRVLDAHGFEWRKVRRDGDLGPLSIKATHMAGWLLGFSRKRLNQIAKGEITKSSQKFIRREWRRTEPMKRADKQRKPEVKKLREAHNSPDPDGDGLGTFDGRTVDAAFIPWLKKAREAGWTGTVVSGYRTPEYSEGLCYQMCGSPTCPGRCAGRSSRHSQKNGNGAVDVSDYYRFGQLMKQLGAPFWNGLGAADPVHFSKAGN